MAAARASAAASFAAASSSSGVGPAAALRPRASASSVRERCANRRRRFAAQGEPLPAAAQPVERRRALSRPPATSASSASSACRSARKPSRRSSARGGRTALERRQPRVRRPRPLRSRRRSPRQRRGRPRRLGAAASSARPPRRTTRAAARLGVAQISSQARRAARPRPPGAARAARPPPAAGRGPERGLAPSGRVGQLLLGRLALGEQRREPLLRAAAAERGRGLALLRLGPPCLRGREIELRDARLQAGDLDGELLGALGRGRLQREGPQALAHLVLDVARPLDLGRDPGQLQLRAVLAPLELAEPGRLLDERPPVLRLGGEHGVDLALADDRVHRAAQADVGEQLDEVGAPHRRPVDEVLPLAAAVQPPRDRDLGEVELGAEAAVGVVEDELDLAVVRRAGAPRRRRRARRRASPRAARRASASRPPRRSRRRRSTCPSRSARRRRRRPARASSRRGPGTT